LGPINQAARLGANFSRSIARIHAEKLEPFRDRNSFELRRPI
jgi:hypothetical protein